MVHRRSKAFLRREIFNRWLWAS